jgi:hypothetical protein
VASLATRVRPPRLNRGVSSTIHDERRHVCRWEPYMSRSWAKRLTISCAITLIACSARHLQAPSWLIKGFPVYISRELLPDPDQVGLAGQPATVELSPTGGGYTPLGGGVRVKPGTTLAPLGTHLPACEPVEVRSATAEYLLVRWLGEDRYRSTLRGDWTASVHRTKEECLERVISQADAP